MQSSAFKPLFNILILRFYLEVHGRTRGWQLWQMLFRDKANIVSRESGDFPRNRDNWKFFLETRVNSGTLQKKSGHRRKFYLMYPKNSGGWSKFLGWLELRSSIVQTAFVKVVSPREELQTFGCIAARTASRAFSRSPAWRGPRRPPPDIGLRGSCRPPALCLAGAECFLSPAKAEYLGKDY